jgi:RNA polymerase-binding transcription factor DksA
MVDDSCRASFTDSIAGIHQIPVLFAYAHSMRELWRNYGASTPCLQALEDRWSSTGAASWKTWTEKMESAESRLARPCRMELRGRIVSQEEGKMTGICVLDRTGFYLRDLESGSPECAPHSSPTAETAVQPDAPGYSRRQRRCVAHDRCRSIEALIAKCDARIADIQGWCREAPASHSNAVDLAASVSDWGRQLATLGVFERRLLSAHHALERASLGIADFCEDCGAEIESGRLVALPEATTCIGCQRRRETGHL